MYGTRGQFFAFFSLLLSRSCIKDRSTEDWRSEKKREKDGIPKRGEYKTEYLGVVEGGEAGGGGRKRMNGRIGDQQ